jgi:hypothetical protein
MWVVDRPARDCIDLIRCPVIKGLPTDTVEMLHKSMVEIVHLRRSIEFARIGVDHSWRAVLESNELLRRLPLEGF